jgi:16S rRNA (cytidine1402-2'-O)-methyltransferase
VSLHRKIFSFVSVPIGHSEDITLRALRTLRKSEVIVAEQVKPARQLLKAWDIPFFEGEFRSAQKEVYLFPFNENHSFEDSQYLRDNVLSKVQQASYISDAGSPLFEDPGAEVLDCLKGFQVDLLPGVTSLSAFMMHFPNDLRHFFVGGFLPRKRQDRVRKLQEFRSRNEPVFFMETPYRLKPFMEDLAEVFPRWSMLFAYQLTTPEECVLRGPVPKVSAEALTLKKGPHVVLLIPGPG